MCRAPATRCGSRRDAAPANGDYSVIAVTAALSVTVPASSTLGFSSATPGRIWLTAINNGGTVSLAVINCYTQSSGDIYPLAGWGIVGVTAFGGGANNAQTFYGVSTLAGVPYGVLGYASYETGSTLATAGTWSAVPTRLELYRPGVALPGALVQSNLSANAAASTGSNNYSPSATVPTTAHIPRWPVRPAGAFSRSELPQAFPAQGKFASDAFAHAQSASPTFLASIRTGIGVADAGGTTASITSSSGDDSWESTSRSCMRAWRAYWPG
jgi:hypothetical protein